MKKIVYLIVTLLFFGGCQKKDAFCYLDPLGGLQFDYNTMERNLNFSFLQNGEGKYLGDSIQYDTLKLALAVVGYSLDQERTLMLDTLLVEGQDSSKVVRVSFLPPYTFKANKNKDTVKIIVHRPPTRGVYVVGITFDWDQVAEEFGRGVKERLVYQLKITDHYPKPEKWNDTYFGPYSEEKYAFYVTIIGDIMDHFKVANGKSYNQRLRNALKEYNEAHPDTPKDFIFPPKV